MFATKIWDRTGLVLAVGPPGSEKTFLSDHIIREARMSGYSTRKIFHRLDQKKWDGTQVVSTHPRFYRLFYGT